VGTNSAEAYDLNGCVHRYFQEVNILCEGEKLVLVGFAWGGKNVEVSYLTTELSEELFAVCDTAGDLKIRKDPDI